MWAYSRFFSRLDVYYCAKSGFLSEPKNRRLDDGSQSQDKIFDRSEKRSIHWANQSRQAIVCTNCTRSDAAWFKWLFRTPITSVYQRVLLCSTPRDNPVVDRNEGRLKPELSDLCDGQFSEMFFTCNHHHLVGDGKLLKQTEKAVISHDEVIESNNFFPQKYHTRSEKCFKPVQGSSIFHSNPSSLSNKRSSQSWDPIRP